MKKLTILLFTLILTLSFSACGGDKEDSPASSNSGSASSEPAEAAKDSKGGKYPAFSGDTLELFGLEWEEAFDTIGEGATSSTSDYISNEDIGLYVRLTNRIDDMETYRVGTVAIEKPGDISFYGIKVGDTLKAADKLFMDSGASYGGGLGWRLDINGKTFSVKLTTSDDKTIDSIEAADLNASGSLDYADPNEQEVPDNPYAYEEDLHELEPNYWE